MKTKFLLLFIMNSCIYSYSQSNSVQQRFKNIKFELLSYGPDTVHARGIQVFDNNIYAANSNGHVYQLDLKTLKSEKISTKSYIELRDIHVISPSNLLVMQSNDTCFVINYEKKKTKNEHSSSSCEIIFHTFLDAFDINKNGFGVLLGDPVNGMFQVFTTLDYGKNWNQTSSFGLQTIEGEAGFAASGTTVQVINDSTYYFISGGKASNLYKSFDFGKTWKKEQIPFEKSEASGPFSMSFKNQKEGVVIGGNYSKPQDTTNTCFITKDGGKTWQKPKKTVSGYRSCVRNVKNVLYACGSNGIDVSFDFGDTWHLINSNNSFAISNDEKNIYVSQKSGKILKFKQLKPSTFLRSTN